MVADAAVDDATVVEAATMSEDAYDGATYVLEAVEEAVIAAATSVDMTELDDAG